MACSARSRSTMAPLQTPRLSRKAAPTTRRPLESESPTRHAIFDEPISSEVIRPRRYVMRLSGSLSVCLTNKRDPRRSDALSPPCPVFFLGSLALSPIHSASTAPQLGHYCKDTRRGSRKLNGGHGGGQEVVHQLATQPERRPKLETAVQALELTERLGCAQFVQCIER